MGTVFGRNLAVVDGLGAVVCSPRTPRGGQVTFVCGMLTVGRRAVTGSSVKIARRVVTGFGLSVTQSGRHVPVLRGQAGLAAAHSCQLVGPRIFAVLGGLCSILGRHLAVIDSVRPIIRSLGVARWRPGTIAFHLLALTSRAVPFASVKIARRVIPRCGRSVTLLGNSVTHVRGQIAVASFNVALARRHQCVLVFLRQSAPA